MQKEGCPSWRFRNLPDVDSEPRRPRGMLIFEEGMTYGFAWPEGATQCVFSCSRLQAKRPEKVASKGSGLQGCPAAVSCVYTHIHAACTHLYPPPQPCNIRTQIPSYQSISMSDKSLMLNQKMPQKASHN